MTKLNSFVLAAVLFGGVCAMPFAPWKSRQRKADDINTRSDRTRGTRTARQHFPP
ncbi:hypothetical protein MNQ96_03795 [Sphingopyxis granuli]|uniref:hypothetical protein n=1 Tax=Sphingopyxis granuli TaxID=267128 RepID=UPI001F530F87|nr:hypothetical protein [Sphingopyxis granuli]UNK80220.1 hypothetical protein MNQ96_03795 [Sphingopyxis granuli]